MPAEPWDPEVLGRSTSVEAMQKVEDAFERAVIRGFRPIVELVEENWEREAPLAAVVAGEQRVGLRTRVSVARRFAMPDNVWDDASQQLLNEIADSLGAAMLLGADAARSDLPGFEVNWSLQNAQAIAWMREWAADLVKGLVATTRNNLRETLAAGMGLGESRDKLASRVKATMADIPEWRARLIAQTETIRAYNQGSLQIYRESGVVEKKEWLDGQLGACPLCTDLNHEVVGLEESFKGGVESPPRHPGCRCAIRAVVEDDRRENKPLPDQLGGIDVSAFARSGRGLSEQSFKGPWGAGAKIKDWQNYSLDILDGKIDPLSIKARSDEARVALAVGKIGQSSPQTLMRGMRLSDDQVSELKTLWSRGDDYLLPLSSFSRSEVTARSYSRWDQPASEKGGWNSVIVEARNARSFDFGNSWEFVSMGRFRVVDLITDVDAKTFRLVLETQ